MSLNVLHHDPDTNTLIYQVPDPDLQSKTLELMPEARLLGPVDGFESLLAIPLPRETLPRLLSLQNLAWLGFSTPDAIGAEYGWPIQEGRRALAHQKRMSNFLVINQRCFNLTSMGGMKTYSAVAAADWLMSLYPYGTCRCLIVSPLSTLNSVWRDTIRHNFPHRRYAILHGSRQSRWMTLESNADFYIINFDGLALGAEIIDPVKRGEPRRLVLTDFSQRLFQRLHADIQIVIIDEATAYKNSTTKRHLVAEKLFDDAVSYLWLQTGTPTPQEPTDAHGIAELVNGAYGESLTSFRNRTMKINPDSNRLEPVEGAYDEAAKLLTPSIRVDIRTIWDAPPLLPPVDRWVEHTADQKKALKQLKEELVIQFQSGELVNAVNQAAARTKLLQIVLGAVYDHDKNRHYFDATPRLQELLSVIQQCDRKVLVLSCFTSVVDLICDYLNKHGFAERVVKITGKTTMNQRTEVIADFQNPRSNIKVIAADPGCMSHGIDLFEADTNVWYGPTDSNERYRQTIHRLHRPGQQWPVSTIRLVSTRVESTIFSRLEAKEDLQDLMLEALTTGAF